MDVLSGSPANLGEGPGGKALKDEGEEAMVEVGGPDIRCVCLCVRMWFYVCVF